MQASVRSVGRRKSTKTGLRWSRVVLDVSGGHRGTAYSAKLVLRLPVEWIDGKPITGPGSIEREALTLLAAQIEKWLEPG